MTRYKLYSVPYIKRYPDLAHESFLRATADKAFWESEIELLELPMMQAVVGFDDRILESAYHMLQHAVENVDTYLKLWGKYVG